MKKIILATALLLMSSSVMAIESQVFLGVDGAVSKADYKEGLDGTITRNSDGLSISNISESGDESDTTFGIKAGVVLDKKHRLYGYYTKPEYDGGTDNAEVEIITFNYEYLFETESDKLSPYFGGHIGQGELEYSGLSDKGLVYGIQAGILYDITENIGFEVGVSYSWSDVKVESSSVSGPIGDYTLTDVSVYVEAENISRGYVGLNFKF